MTPMSAATLILRCSCTRALCLAAGSLAGPLSGWALELLVQLGLNALNAEQEVDASFDETFLGGSRSGVRGRGALGEVLSAVEHAGNGGLGRTMT